MEKIGMVYAAKDPDGGFCYYEYREGVGYTKYSPFTTLEEADRAAAAHAARLPELLNYIPAEEPQQPQGDPLEAFERAGVISDLEITPLTAAECAELSAAAAETAATQEAPAAEEETDTEPQRLTYISSDGSGATTSTAEALRWHRAGDDLIIYHPGRPAAYLHGAPQEKPREEDENRAHCKHIALELDAYVNGEVKRCPECGEIHRRDWDDVGDAFKCPNCGDVASVDDWEWLGVYDFLADVYNIEYRTSGRGADDLRSVCVMVACGGPNIYIDTESKNVELYWWSDRAWYPLSSDAVNAVDEWADELWRYM